jgi:hypothetical protein
MSSQRAETVGAGVDGVRWLLLAFAKAGAGGRAGGLGWALLRGIHLLFHFLPDA